MASQYSHNSRYNRPEENTLVRKKEACKLSHKFNENTLQKEIVRYLNEISGLGCSVNRVKNMGTYDPVARCFRKGGTEKGIPDIIGCTKDGRAIFIEVKRMKDDGRIGGVVSPPQREFLIEKAKRGAIVGIACCFADAFDIVIDDAVNYPRLDRTFGNKKLRLLLAGGTQHETKLGTPKTVNPVEDKAAESPSTTSECL